MIKNRSSLTLILIFGIIITSITVSQPHKKEVDTRFEIFIADPKKTDIALYWKDENNRLLNTFDNLKNYIEKKGKHLIFAMNAGMFMEDYTPLGLYIQKEKIIHRLNTSTGNTNFYIQPNGVFYITTDKKPIICITSEYVHNRKIRFATQSGPMLLVNGVINSNFKKGSANINIRNGVGILPDNKVVFIISVEPVNFYDFAEHFKNQGCLNALYLDGAISAMYSPEKKLGYFEGNFGVMIGIAE
jgi:uncharacterized protein YigE (DUF2233 family)